MVYAQKRPRAPGTGKNRCHYCGIRGGRTKDHIVPKARGGSDRPINIVPACGACNSAKADSWPTCECDACTAAVDYFRKGSPEEVGPRCIICGLVTMTPEDCPWCVEEVAQVSART